MGERQNNDILTTLAFLAVGVWAVSAVFRIAKWILSPPKHHANKTKKSWQEYIPECDTKKAAKIERGLNVICKGFAWFSGGLSFLLIIVAITIDSGAWKPGLAFGVFALLFYLFSKSTVVKDAGRVEKNKVQRQANFPQNSNHGVGVIKLYPRKKRVGMIIAASFFAVSSFAYFVMSFLEIEFIGPAVGAGILSFMFTIFSKTSKSKTHIWKIPKCVFVILCLAAIILAGVIITQITPPIKT